MAGPGFTSTGFTSTGFVTTATADLFGSTRTYTVLIPNRSAKDLFLSKKNHVLQV